MLAMLMSSPALAWEFTDTNLVKRSFEVKNELDAVFLVHNVRCTASDGKDSLIVKGYFSPTGKWNNLNKLISGSNIRGKLNQIDSDLLPAYMKFCAQINSN